MKVNIPESDFPRIVIVGGGFAGIQLARSLRKAPYQVVLIDKHNYHTFQPLLYQVATGGLEPDSIAFPLRKAFTSQKNMFFRMAEVQSIDADVQSLETTLGSLSYDYLIIATGSKTNFFGMEEVEANAVGMKNVPEALDLRHMILQNFERFLQEPDTRELLQFVVVGGGPTGVETAGALAELKRHVLPSDYPEIDWEKMEITLVEAGPSLLGGMSEKSTRDALKGLTNMGVKVELNTMVKDYNGSIVFTNEGEIPAGAVIWAAGIKGNLIDGLEKMQTERGARIVVDKYNRVSGYENIFALGDLAFMETEAYPKGHPQVAPVAMQQGTLLAENLIRESRKIPWKAFKYFDKGSMATIGRNKAVVDLGKLHLKGRLAWLAWMFIHLLFLIGFRNKLVVFVNWIWSYFTYDKGTRVIIRPFRKRTKEALPVT
ncbi:MAG: NAD(P)/FAD-dependent oxidoreductase [Bacteroidota bacterium]